MRKSLLNFGLSVLLSAGMSLSVSAESVTVGKMTFDLDTEAKTATLASQNAMTGLVTIPSTVSFNDETYTVTAIGENVFMNNKNITEVTIPATIKSIGVYAFRNTQKLKRVNAESLESWLDIDFDRGMANPLYMGATLYVGAQKMVNVTVPEGVTVLKPYAFYKYKNLLSIKLPSTLTEIGNTSLHGTSISAITIPESVSTIGDYAFWQCASLKSVVIPEGITALGTSLFDGCTALESVTIPSTVATVGSSVFSGCESLASLTFPASVTEFKSGVFSGCHSLTELKVEAVTPPVTEYNELYGYVFTTFDDFNQASCTLYVPAAGIEDYKAAQGWKDFTNIEALNSSGIEKAEADEDEQPEVYYNLQGVKVANPATGAVYVVKRGSKVNKVFVK